MFKSNRWEIVASTGTHFDVLDGLRGVAILLVVAHHALHTNPHGSTARLAGYLIEAGWMGVPIFFVLSGFLISYPFFQRRHANPQFCYESGYAWRRMAKILPPFYSSVLLFGIISWWATSNPAYLNSLWKWAIGLGAFMPIAPDFNSVYWSLMVEAQYYIALPLCFWLTRGQSVLNTGKVIFTIFFTVSLMVRHWMWPENVYVLPDNTSSLFQAMWFKLLLFPCQLDYFAWEVLFAAVYVPLTFKKTDGLQALSLFGYAGLVLLATTLIFWGAWVNQFELAAHLTRWSVEVSHLLPAIATLLMLFFIFDRQCLGARLLSASWLRFVGIVSYEWFLFHLPIMSWFHQHFGPSQGNILMFAWQTLVPLALTFGFSVLVYRWFSLPIIKHVRNRLKSRKSTVQHHSV
jgi:peptidoglycan/LPS O-acetylase OafA/YrhL